MYKEILARNCSYNSEKSLREKFKENIHKDSIVDCIYVDSLKTVVVGICDIDFEAPVIMEMFKDYSVYACIIEITKQKRSMLFKYDKSKNKIFVFTKVQGEIKEIELNNIVLDKIHKILLNMVKWPGILNNNGEHIIDLKSPQIGPHYSVNLLIGQRIGFDNPLQTTPKSVVDILGRGSSRSHADTQVLATRWDMRQEENGFPANRQFYLYEENNQIFYSANPYEDNIYEAKCIHSQNYTTIKYRTNCGIEVDRLIFILAQEDNLPIATEVHEIKIKNNSNEDRKIRFIYSGMFGSSVPLTLYQDVLYSNIVMQAKLVQNINDSSILALGTDYSQNIHKDDLRFHSTVLKQNDKLIFPTEFCTDYNEFVGNGTLEKPQGTFFLNSTIKRIGPGFFAIALDIDIKSNEEVIIDNFTGLVSLGLNSVKKDRSLYVKEITNLISLFNGNNSVSEALKKNIAFYNKYKSFIQIKSDDIMFDVYFNNNLPFQVFYQTFVSRSFCQTQKGYRETGFREIQDIFSSMYYFIGMGFNDLVKKLILEWASKIFEMGYAYHNFYWEGKEPGKASDDAIWFVKVVCKYINITGEIEFLDEKCKIAKIKPIKVRSLYNTIKAIIRYSGEISIGKHGLPLLDYYDWNECLKVDTDAINGVTKEKLYKKQLRDKDQIFGERFESEYSESVMNAFLLKSSIDEMMYLAEEKGDLGYNSYLASLSNKLYNNVQNYTWKTNFFARVLFNKANQKNKYLGAENDGFSMDKNTKGTYFLNSFTWAIFSNIASEEQICLMLDQIEKYIKTKFGLKLLSDADLSRLSDDMPNSLYFKGDRENGGILKHACMMAVKAMFKCANEVKSRDIAKHIISLAYWMLDLVLPYETVKNPFILKGNPRFCTKYINSETGESIGPLVSGTSTWFTLALFSSLGFDINRNSIVVNPILRESCENLELKITISIDTYYIKFRKPIGFKRILDNDFKVLVDGKEYFCNAIPIFYDGKGHNIDLNFE